MDLTSKKIIKELLSKYNCLPSKRLGQNFLTNKLTLDKIIEATELNQKDTVLEIGPGMGTLTKELSALSEKVIAVEKDKKMAEILKETLADCKNVEVINEDALKFNPKKYGLASVKYKMVANLPYYAASPIIRMFLEAKNPPEFMVIMIQKEVAQRICGRPPSMSLLAASVQFYAEPKIVSHVSKNCFWPAPKVDSAIIKIAPQNTADREQINADLFFKIVKAGFSHPRKQLAGNLSNSLKKDKKSVDLWLLENNIDPSRRAETLVVSDWKRLAASFQ